MIVKLTFRWERARGSQNVYAIEGIRKYNLMYFLTRDTGAMETGTAGTAYQEDQYWVGHTERYQKSNCSTRKEAGEWIEHRFKANLGFDNK